MAAWTWDPEDEQDLVRAERRLDELRYRAPERVKDMVASLRREIARMRRTKDEVLGRSV